MSFWTTIICIMLFAVQSAFAAPRLVSPLDSETDPDSLIPFLKKGELSLVQSKPDGTLEQVASMVLIDAPLKKVFDTITDYATYKSFLPNVVKSDIVYKDADHTDVSMEVDVPIKNIHYTLRYRTNGKSVIEIELVKGDIKTGAYRWDLIDTDDGTLVIYTTVTDLSETSWIMKKLISSQPTIEHAANVATGILTVKAVKKEAEKRAAWRE